MIRQRRQQIQRQRISPKLRMALLSSGVFALAAVILITYSNTGLHLNAVAGQGMSGKKIIAAGETVLNEFTVITTDVKAGSTQINVADNTLNAHERFDGDLRPGELIMIVQMQTGAKSYVDLNEEKGITDEAGKYEFAEVAGVEEGPKINFTAALKNSYTVNGKTQIIRVPRFQDFSIEKGAIITTDMWDGNTGGIVAVEVKGNATINGTIDVTGKGFNSKAFQKLLKSASENRKALITADTLGTRIYFGAASINKTLNTQSSGGGIVCLLVTGLMQGTGVIRADGSSIAAGGERQACGGQGGTVYVCSAQSEGSITITANGGNAQQEIDSMKLSVPPGQGGDGGIIRAPDIKSLHCIAEGGFHAPVMKLVNGVVTMDSVKASVGTITASGINPYSANPVSATKLEYFAATAMNGSVKVSWVTTSEVNVDYFTVERSADGNDFIPVFKINGKGNTGGKSNYEFEDVIQPTSDHLYRLVEMNQDEHKKIFPPIRIRQMEKNVDTKVLSVQPNPFSDQLTIKCNVGEAGLLDISITDISGNIIRRESTIAGAGMNTIPVHNLTGIPKGTYFLSVSTSTQKVSTVKILK